MDLFSKIKSFQTVWPSSVVQWEHSTWKVARDLYFLCVTHARSVLFVHDLYLSRSLCARCSHRSRVQTPTFPARSFCRSRVRFPGLIACVRPVKSLAYVTRPHEWSNRWHVKQTKTLSEVKKSVCMTGCPLSCEAVKGNLLV